MGTNRGKTSSRSLFRTLVRVCSRAYTREAAIGPNKPDRFRAEFLLFGLILAHLLIKSPLQPRFLSRNDARKRSVLCILEMEKTAVNEARTLTDVSTDYAEAMKSFLSDFRALLGLIAASLV